jgi:hypothetical protein
MSCLIHERAIFLMRSANSRVCVCFDFRVYSLPFCQQTLAAVSVCAKNNWINTENGPSALETELSLIVYFLENDFFPDRVPIHQ